MAIGVYAIADILSVFFRFFFLRNRNQYIFFESCEVQKSFSFFFIFSCEGSFFFGKSSKCLSVDRLRCEQRRFYVVTSVGLVLYILADLGPCGELLTKQTSFLVQPFVRLARTELQNFTSLAIFACHNIACKPPRNVRTRTTFKAYSSKPTQDKLNRDKTADVGNSQL